MISLEHQIAVLADLEINYKKEMLTGNWLEFFLNNNVGVPLSTLLTLGLAEFPKNESDNFYAKTLITKAFIAFAEELSIDPNLDYITAQHMFDWSKNDEIVTVEQR